MTNRLMSSTTPVLPDGFIFDPTDGLFAKIESGAPATFICGPFDLVGEFVNDRGQNPLLVFGVRGRDGRKRPVRIFRTAAHSRGGAAIAAELTIAGLHCNPSAAAHEALALFVAMVRLPKALNWREEPGRPADGR